MNPIVVLFGGICVISILAVVVNAYLAANHPETWQKIQEHDRRQKKAIVDTVTKVATPVAGKILERLFRR
ncbi:MAG TPA: hypothetical protein VGN12_07690 [Pirellulales bacterium]|jgi:hypothetical protein